MNDVIIIFVLSGAACALCGEVEEQCDKSKTFIEPMSFDYVPQTTFVTPLRT